MSNLDTRYNLHLDLEEHVENEMMYFSLSDTNTSDFYIDITKGDVNINNILSSNTATLYVLKPNKNVDLMEVTYDEENDVYYCNLPNNLKNIKGSYTGQVIFTDSETGERRAITSKFRYRVKEDLLSDLGENIPEDNNVLLDLIDKIDKLEERLDNYDGGGIGDLDLIYQRMEDDRLNTNDKSVVGSINELKYNIDNIQIEGIEAYVDEESETLIINFPKKGEE